MSISIYVNILGTFPRLEQDGLQGTTYWHKLSGETRRKSIDWLFSGAIIEAKSSRGGGERRRGEREARSRGDDR